MLEQNSLLEIALEIMNEKSGSVNIYDLIDEVLNRKGITDDDGTLAAKLYTDIIVSSSFVFMGDDMWDLKSRQSLEQFEKDGYDFKHASDDEDEDRYEDEDDEEDEDRSEDEDDEEDEDGISEDDLDDEEELESEDDVEYESYDEDEDEDDESYDDTSLDEEKYNKYMDDYEKLYED